MNKLKRISAVTIVLAAVALLGLVTVTRMGAQGTQSQTIHVTITPNSTPTGPPTVKPESVSVGRHDQVEWTCSSGCDFTVAFTESNRKPFNQRAFDKAHPKSGTPTGPPGTYKYSVIVGQGVADPQIIVH